MVNNSNNELYRHLADVKDGKRCFENAFQGVTRMILESDISKVMESIMKKVAKETQIVHGIHTGDPNTLDLVAQSI